MKTRIILIVLLVVILVPLAGAVFYFLRSRSEMSKMTPLPTGEVVPGVYAIRDEYVNLYLVPCAQKWIAFDAGISEKNVRQGLADLNIDPRNVSAVFLTHTDYDHTGALPLFQNTIVYISQTEEQMIDGQTRRSFIFSNRLVTPYQTLADGQTVEVPGCSVTGILTPGHTPGSMVYRINDAHLFSGDTFSLKNGQVRPFNDFYNMDTPRQMVSLKNLSNLDGLVSVFSAHYGSAPASALR